MADGPFDLPIHPRTEDLWKFNPRQSIAPAIATAFAKDCHLASRPCCRNWPQDGHSKVSVLDVDHHSDVA